LDTGHPFHPTTADPVVVASLRRLLANEHFDIVHSHDWMVNSYLAVPRTLRTPPHVHSAHEYGLLCAKKTLALSEGGRERSAQCPGPALGRCLSCASRSHGAVKGAGLTLGLRWSRHRYGEIDQLFGISNAVLHAHAGDRSPVASTPAALVPEFVPD